MNTKVLLAALAGGIAYFFLGWLVYGMLLGSTFHSMMTTESAAVTRPETEMIMWAMAVSCLVFGLLLAVIYSRWANISTFKTGAIAGAIITFLMTLGTDLGMFSMYNLTTGGAGLLINPIVNAALGGIIGGVVGWVLGYGGDKK
ncbi:MAG: hypothetical protein ACKVUS_22080 [Saprospiraceae bacterium]